MTIQLDHTIVPARDKEASARFFGHIMGLPYEGVMGHFAPVRINDALTFDFDQSDDPRPQHYAFHVTDEEFDSIFGRIQAEGIAYGSGPGTPDDMRFNYRKGGRGFYFRDPNGHLLELLTVS
ncbi:MAG: VOC family protein [Dehalococcoidia bacterium]